MKRMMTMILAAVLGFVSLGLADTMDEAKERRKARRAQIVELVQAGEAQEGADGYLVPKEGLAEAKAALVKAENADRKIGYEAIAKANNKSADEIGRKAGEINKAKAPRR